MRCYDNGCFFSVTCSKSDVYKFARQWPCFGRIRAYWFQFDKRNGDLVDTNHKDGETDDSGIRVLADNAKSYGVRRLKLNL